MTKLLNNIPVDFSDIYKNRIKILFERAIYNTKPLQWEDFEDIVYFQDKAIKDINVGLMINPKTGNIFLSLFKNDLLEIWNKYDKRLTELLSYPKNNDTEILIEIRENLKKTIKKIIELWIDHNPDELKKESIKEQILKFKIKKYYPRIMLKKGEKPLLELPQLFQNQNDLTLLCEKLRYHNVITDTNRWIGKSFINRQNKTINQFVAFIRVVKPLLKPEYQKRASKQLHYAFTRYFKHPEFSYKTYLREGRKELSEDYKSAFNFLRNYFEPIRENFDQF